MFRIGIGYDSHRFQAGQRLILGGVQIPFEMGLISHSDGDVLVHAIIDAILGAIGSADIGTHFPDTDSKFRGISSLELLRQTLSIMQAKGFEIVNVDSIIIAQKPKLSPYIKQMKDTLQNAGITSINIKAKTNEHMGFVGRLEGIASQAVCLVKLTNP